MQSYQLGQWAEEKASEYLQQKGLLLVEKNYRSRLGEIDLIMKDSGVCVFVEVRLRNHKGYATVLESVTRAKQQKIIKTASYYLQTHRLSDKMVCRFDVIAVALEGEQCSFDWVKQAF